MKFSVNTIYNLERLLRFNTFYFLRKRVFWSIIAIALVLVSVAFTMNIALGWYDSTITIGFVVVVVAILFAAFSFFILPRFIIKKSTSYNADVLIEFCEEKFTITAKVVAGVETSELDYSFIKKMMESKQDMYIFASSSQAFILDKSAFSHGTPEELKEFLINKGIKYKR